MVKRLLLIALILMGLCATVNAAGGGSVITRLMFYRISDSTWVTSSGVPIDSTKWGPGVLSRTYTYNPIDSSWEPVCYGDSTYRAINLYTVRLFADTIKTALVHKIAFGNAAANLRDTILCAGVKTDSTICAPNFIYSSTATTHNAITYYVRPDTIFVLRSALTDPDTFSILIVKKR
jgi:hypothetical protein